MAIVVKDRVKENFSSTGTADFTLGGAVTGFQAFSAIGNNNFTYYSAYDPATGDWEVGYGQYSTTGPTLTRNTVLSSSAAGAKVSFGTGTKDVFCAYPAEKAIYEEETGNVLIDGGPITIVGSGVSPGGYTSFSGALGEMYANIPSYAQFYGQNYSDNAEASADFVMYNDLGDGLTNFVDMGINSSLYNSLTYPIFTGGSAYVFNDGGELFLGSATDDVVLFAGGVATTDEAVRIDKTTKKVSAVGDIDVGGALTVVSSAEFQSTVLLSANPTLALQAAPKQYVDAVASLGIIIHPAVRLETIGNLSATYSNGTLGVGATLTNNSTQVALVCDGVAVNNGDRIIVMDQTAQAENGVYVVTDKGSVSTNWVLTRATDADTYGTANPAKLAQGSYFYITSGNTAAGESYTCSTVGTIIFGTTAITFSQFSAAPTYTGTAPINVSGQVISLTGTVDATHGGTGTNTVTTGDLLYGSATNTWSNLPLGTTYKVLVSDSGGTPLWGAVALNQSVAVSGTLPATNGGTGIASYAQGEMVYANTTTTLDKVTANTTTTKKFLSQTGTGTVGQAPVWAQPAASDITGLAPSATTDTTNANNITSGTLGTSRLSGSYTGITGVGTLTAGTWNANTIGVTYGGTGIASYAVGDLVYADTTTSLAKLADVAVGNALISGGVGSAPSYGKIGLATHVSGTLPIANGGTNSTTTPTAGAVAFGTGTAYSFTAAGTSGQVLTSSGSGTPVWSTVSSGASISNDTTTSTYVYPLFAAATSGTPTVVYTGNANLLYKPSTGEFTSRVVNAGNAIFTNSQTVATSYTIAVGQSGMSSGPVTIASGQSVTVSAGSRWVIV